MRKGGSFLAFLSGMVVGAVTALLLVPESGEETRRRLKETGLRRLRDLENEVRRLREEVERKFRELREARATGEADGEESGEEPSGGESRVDVEISGDTTEQETEA